MLIRPAQQGDIPALAAVWHDVWHESHAPFVPPAVTAYRDTAFFEARIRVFRTCLMLSEDDSGVTGLTVWEPGHLRALFVAPQARGTGVAADLLQIAETQIKASGARQADLAVLPQNIRATRFYQRYGWQAAGERIAQLPVTPDDTPVFVSVPYLRLAKRL